MNKKLTILFLLAIPACSFFKTQNTLAEINSTTENHPMGSMISKTVQQPLNSSSNRLRSYAMANSVVNLSPNENGLPSEDAVDIASHQSWMTQADFYSLKSQGVKTIVVKLTEGTYYTNPYAASQIRMAQNAGLSIATYHFAIFGNTSNQATANSQAIAEANYYAGVARTLGISTNSTMVEDAENTSTDGSVWTQSSQNFKTTLNNAGYSNVKFYTSSNWLTSSYMNANILGFKNIWVAQYLYGTPYTNTTGWTNSFNNNSQYGAWQFTSQMYFNSTTNLANNNLDASVDFSNFFTNLNSTNPVYRMYNPNSGEHFYTMNYYEVQSLQNSDWNYEGIGWNSLSAVNTGTVYRLYNKNGGYHFYTTSSYEKDQLVKKGWTYEGISFYTGGTKAVYRAYNPNNGMHNYTLISYEQRSLLKLGWKDEGTAWKSY